MKFIIICLCAVIAACAKQPQPTQETLTEIVIYDKYTSKAYQDRHFVEYFFTGHIGKARSEGDQKCFSQQNLEVGKKYKLMIPSDKDGTLIKVNDLCELTTRIKIYSETNASNTTGEMK